jgi:purine-binding chemotaxis protein CheW
VNRPKATDLDALLDRRAERLARRGQSGSGRDAVLEVVEVEIAGERFGIPLQATQQIVRMPRITELPGLPAWILGVTQVRGRLVSVLDLGRWFGLEATPNPASLVLISSRSRLLGIAANAVLDARAVFADELPEDDRGTTARERPVSAVTNDLLSILDVQRLLDSPEVLV